MCDMIMWKRASTWNGVRPLGWFGALVLGTVGSSDSALTTWMHAVILILASERAARKRWCTKSEFCP